MIKATPCPNTLDECIDVVNEMQRHYSDPRYGDALAWLIDEAKKAQRYRKTLRSIEHFPRIANDITAFKNIKAIARGALKDGD